MDKTYRYSKQRELIYQAVCDTASHPSAQMLYEHSKVKHPSLSLGTVYRNLATLEQMGKIVKVQSPQNVDRYEKTQLEHGHFYCVKCHSIYDIAFDDLQKTKASLENKTSFTINTLKLQCYGICCQCQEQTNLE